MSYVRSNAWREAQEENKINNPEKINEILSQLRLESETRKKEAEKVGVGDVALKNFMDMSLTGLATRKIGNRFDDAPITKEEFESSPFYHKDIPYTQGMTMKEAEYNYESNRKRKQVEAWYKENPILQRENVFSGNSIQYSNIPKRTGAFALNAAGFIGEMIALGAVATGTGAVAVALGAPAVIGTGLAGAGEILGFGIKGSISKAISERIGAGLFGKVVGRGAEGLIQGATYETLIKKAGLTDELIKEGDKEAKDRELSDIFSAGLTAGGIGASIPIIGRGIKAGKGLLYKSKKADDKIIDFAKNELISNEIRNNVNADLDTLPLKSNEVQTPSGRVTMPEKLFSNELGHDVTFNYKVVDLSDIKAGEKLAKAEDAEFVLNGMFSRESMNTFNKGAMLLDAENNLQIGKRRYATLTKMFEDGGETLEKYIGNLQNTGHDISKMERPVLARILETPLSPEEISKLILLSDDLAPKIFNPINNKSENVPLFPESIKSNAIGKELNVKYAIMELEELKRLNNIRNNITNTNLDIRKMIISGDDLSGAPIINKNNKIIGDISGIDRIVSDEQIAKYSSELEKYGFDTVGFEKPILVRTLENDLSKAEIESIKNYQETIRNSKVDEVVKPEEIKLSDNPIENKIEEFKRNADEGQIEALNKVQKDLKDNNSLFDTMKKYADCIMAG